MDPKAALDRCAAALADLDLDDATEALDDYQEWRDRGGFAPPGGDARANQLRDHLVRALVNQHVTRRRKRATR